MSDNRTLTQGEMEWITSRLAGYRRDAWSHSTIENYVRDVERLLQHITVLEQQRDQARLLAAVCWPYAKGAYEPAPGGLLYDLGFALGLNRPADVDELPDWLKERG